MQSPIPLYYLNEKNSLILYSLLHFTFTSTHRYPTLSIHSYYTVELEYLPHYRFLGRKQVIVLHLTIYRHV